MAEWPRCARNVNVAAVETYALELESYGRVHAETDHPFGGTEVLPAAA